MNFSTRTWAERLGTRLLSTQGRLVRAADLPALLNAGAQHVRPDSQDKAFNAAVFDRNSWGALFANCDIEPGLQCWASPPREILQEWRCWVTGKELVAASRYRQDGQMAVERGAPAVVEAFVAQVASQWLPAACVVMDVAQTGLCLQVLEFNPIHCSGWYAADVDKVLQAWLDWSVAQL